jgi:hypothetical protein
MASEPVIASARVGELELFDQALMLSKCLCGGTHNVYAVRSKCGSLALVGTADELLTFAADIGSAVYNATNR